MRLTTHYETVKEKKKFIVLTLWYCILQMKSVQRMLCDSQNSSTPPKLQPNIELQREISTALSSQLRGIKQKLHTTRHDYK